MATSRRNVTGEDLKAEVLAKIATYENEGFPEAGRLHKVVMGANPDLYPRLWYGMPGYAKTKDSAVLCFFRKDTLITFGFTEAVDLSALYGESESYVPSAWYLRKVDAATERMITDVVGKLR